MLVSRKRRLPPSATAPPPMSAAPAPGAGTAMLLHPSVIMRSILSGEQSKQTHSRSTDSSRPNIRHIWLTALLRFSLVAAAAAAGAIEAGTTQQQQQQPLDAASTVGGAAPWREPFVDDGMFDPRRDYWGDGKINRTHSGRQSTVTTTPASSNWAVAGECELGENASFTPKQATSREQEDVSSV